MEKIKHQNLLTILAESFVDHEENTLSEIYQALKFNGSKMKLREVKLALDIALNLELVSKKDEGKYILSPAGLAEIVTLSSQMYLDWLGKYRNFNQARNNNKAMVRWQPRKRTLPDYALVIIVAFKDADRNGVLDIPKRFIKEEERLRGLAVGGIISHSRIELNFQEFMKALRNAEDAGIVETKSRGKYQLTALGHKIRDTNLLT